VVDKAEDAARGVTEHVIAAAGDPTHLEMGQGQGYGLGSGLGLRPGHTY
jgi:hypothetical protein